MLTIALIDKFPVMRSGAEIMFKENFKDVSVLSANDTATFQKLYPKKRADIVILGIAYDKAVNPLDLVPIVKKKLKCPIVVYDDSPVNQICIKYFKAGASGYVSKCSPPSELLSCIQAIILNKRYVDSDALNMIIQAKLPSRLRITSDKTRTWI